MAMGGQERRMQAGEDPVLDRRHLSELAAHVGAAPTRELLAEGAAELAERLDRVERLCEPADPGQLAMTAHQIAGLAASIGLPRLARHASMVAAALREGRDPGRHLAALHAARAASLAALRNWGPGAGS